MTYSGRHYETGTISNALAAMGGQSYSEALAFGASGGIAFGYFVFEYTGQLPHVALLPRNTFSPFERALDNLAIRREVRETTNPAKGVENLRRELDSGNPVIVWADVFSLPYRGLNPAQMWAMQPVLVVGQDGDDFLLVDGSKVVIRISADDLLRARARVKKDRFRIMVLEKPDLDGLPDGLIRGIETCVALFLDKPPAGSANNFGIQGMRHMAAMLTDQKNANGWARKFAPGPRLTQALVGMVAQPGVWGWIETWGTRDAADRETYADFLDEAAAWTGNDHLRCPDLRDSAELWRQLAEIAMPNEIPEMMRMKTLRHEFKEAWIERGLDSLAERAEMRIEMGQLFDQIAVHPRLTEMAGEIQSGISEKLLQIADVEESAMRALRAAVPA